MHWAATRENKSPLMQSLLQPRSSRACGVSGLKISDDYFGEHFSSDFVFEIMVLSTGKAQTA
jgi:hypothetical protein